MSAQFPNIPRFLFFRKKFNLSIVVDNLAVSPQRHRETQIEEKPGIPRKETRYLGDTGFLSDP
jgi:hypothetical protein